ncbi:hypothetical protein ACC840_36290, partial [Rhizobium ruizarguesonis]
HRSAEHPDIGGSVGLPQDFSGIMAKQSRMAVLKAGLLAQSIETLISPSHWSLILASAIIGVGGNEMGEEEGASRRPIASRSSSWA